MLISNGTPDPQIETTAGRPQQCRLASWALCLSVAGPFLPVALLMIFGTLVSILKFNFNVNSRYADYLLLTPIYSSLLATPTGFLLSIIALIKIRLSNGRLQGRSEAKVALAISLVIILLAALLYPVLRDPTAKAKQAICLSNMKQLGYAMFLYAEKHDGRLPNASAWVDELVPYQGNGWGYRCPKNPDKGISYAFNSRLDGLKLDDIKSPDDTVMLFESRTGRNRHGGPELFPDEPRHPGGCNILFVSGRAKWIEKSELGKLNWSPNGR